MGVNESWMRDLLATDRPTIALLAERLKQVYSHPECQRIRRGLSTRLVAIESDLSRIQELASFKWITTYSLNASSIQTRTDVL
jgi:ribosomal protein S7